ncbi:SCP2 sterol-binding domain-containing protein [Sediminimonas sp.]|uniref:ubiquinone anaerobic biosynthesis accessory factor UbiT n=1 Tax=Sediminimonas sp. TaxID=2823379 RepID=UPI0025D96CF6|nr:SCP2 sterol-binding domain-containing protein [Sediminimonas sp.]
MPDSAVSFPLAPRPLAAGLRVLPLFPLAAPLSLLARRVIAANPGLIERLGVYGACRFAIDPTDLPLVLLLHPHPSRARITVHRRPPAEADTRIAGPLAALLGLVHGTWDGDALFFSRDLVIEGDTGAALALRNAIDDAELDLGAEVAGLAGPMRGRLAPLIGLAERVTRLPLRRTREV